MASKPETKICQRCGIEKPVEFFFYSTQRDRYTKLCKACHKKPNYLNLEERRAKRADHERRYMEMTCPEGRAVAMKEAELLRKYGITMAQVEEMMAEQDRKCKICRRGGPLYVDHCHRYGHVRGLLCLFCNSMLGLSRDNPDTLREGADYIEQPARFPGVFANTQSE